jgi:hypothetical protein
MVRRGQPPLTEAGSQGTSFRALHMNRQTCATSSDQSRALTVTESHSLQEGFRTRREG